MPESEKPGETESEKGWLGVLDGSPMEGEALENEKIGLSTGSAGRISLALGLRGCARGGIGRRARFRF